MRKKRRQQMPKEWAVPMATHNWYKAMGDHTHAEIHLCKDCHMARMVVFHVDGREDQWPVPQCLKAPQPFLPFKELS